MFYKFLDIEIDQLTFSVNVTEEIENLDILYKIKKSISYSLVEGDRVSPYYFI